MSGQKKPWVWILLTLAVLVFGCLATCLGSAAFCGLTSKKAVDGASTEVHTFFEILKTNDLQAAYKRTASAYQLEMPFESFQKLVEVEDLTHFSGVDVTVSNVQLNYGQRSEVTFHVVVHKIAGGTTDIVFMVERKPAKAGKGDEPWRIRYITLNAKQ